MTANAAVRFLAMRSQLSQWRAREIVRVKMRGGKTVDIRAGVPRTRADCPDTSVAPCAHIQCRYHLYRVDPCDRAGRPGLSSVPRDAHGHTRSEAGSLGTERAGTTLEPMWLRGGTDSCALDVAARGPQSNEAIGAAIGRHRTLVALEVKGALRHAIDIADGMGIGQADLVAALRGMNGKVANDNA